jgi:hypothetical protein
VYEGEGPLTVDRDLISLPLMAGKNRVLLKVSDAGKEAWGFSLYFPDSSIRNRKNRYRIED